MVCIDHAPSPLLSGHMCINARNLVITYIRNPCRTIAEFPGIRILILIRGDDLVYRVLLELNHCLLVNRNKVKRTSSGESARFLRTGYAVIQLNRLKESSRRYFNHPRPSFQCRTACRGIQRINQIFEGALDKQIYRPQPCFCVFNGALCSHNCTNCILSGCQCSGCRTNARMRSISPETICIQLRNDLRSNEFSRQSGEHRSRFLLIQCIHREHTPPVIGDLLCLVTEIYRPIHEARISAIRGKPVHGHFGNQDFICVCALFDKAIITVQNASKGSLFVYLIQCFRVKFSQLNCVCHCDLLLFFVYRKPHQSPHGVKIRIISTIVPACSSYRILVRLIHSEQIAIRLLHSFNGGRNIFALIFRRP
nr:MAG TPA: hypothetical protein [Caudoviricetes sp.]